MSLPVNLKIGGRLCVIIGGGHVARRKCLKLLEYGARVRVVASHFNEWDSIPKEAALDLIQRPFEEGDLAGAFLVIAATDDPDLNDRIASRAGELGILSLSVDSPESSDFFFPATLKRGDLTVSFSTNGAIPALSAKLMKEAGEQFGAAHEEFCAMARCLRQEAIRKVPAHLRKPFFQKLVDSDLLHLLETGKKGEAERRARELLERFCSGSVPDGVPAGPVSSRAALAEPVANRSGKVYLLGAGPGDPGLLTVKGAECLREADTVLYDCMANPVLLSMYCREAELIDVSKRKGCCKHSQDEIIALLIDKAKGGRTVVRLKGGDPTVFGRGGEEARALQRAGIYYEIVPGVTSAIAVPAYAGIPVTDREYSSSFGVYTVHRKGGLAISEEKWKNIALGPDTLVFLMGKTRCTPLVEKLLEYGRPPSTPVAIIYYGTTSLQKRIVGTLETIVGDTEGEESPGPGLIVVGEVVRAIPEMDWFHNHYLPQVSEVSVFAAVTRRTPG